MVKAEVGLRGQTKPARLQKSRTRPLGWTPHVRRAGGTTQDNSGHRICNEPAFDVFEGAEQVALALVIDLNVNRRHLDESQRAMVRRNWQRCSTGVVGDPIKRKVFRSSRPAADVR